MAGTTRLDIVISGLQGGGGQAGASGSSGQAADAKATETAYKGVASSMEKAAKSAGVISAALGKAGKSPVAAAFDMATREREAQGKRWTDESIKRHNRDERLLEQTLRTQGQANTKAEAEKKRALERTTREAEASANKAARLAKQEADAIIREAKRAAEAKSAMYSQMGRVVAEHAQAVVASELAISRNRAQLEADVLRNASGIRGPGDLIRFGTGTASARLQQQGQEATTRGMTWGGGIGGVAGGVVGSALPGLGTTIGAGIGASLGAAIGDALTTSTANAKAILAGAADAIGNLAGELADMLANAAKIAIGATLAGAIAAAMGALKREPIEQAFREFAESLGGEPVQALESFKAALHGTASEMEIMLAFNRAVSLGAIQTTQQFEALAVAARKMALATGRDIGDALNDIAVGLGRQSFRVLDNIGIIVRATEAYKEYAHAIGKNVKDLSLAERRYAFTNAAMTDLIRKQGTLTSQTDTHRAKWDRLQASMADWKDRVGMKVLELFDRIEPSLRRLGAAIEKLFSSSDVQGTIEGWVDKLAEWIDKAAAYLENNTLEQIWEDAKKAASLFFDFVSASIKDMMGGLNEFANSMASAMEVWSNDGWQAGVKAFSTALEKFTANPLKRFSDMAAGSRQKVAVPAVAMRGDARVGYHEDPQSRKRHDAAVAFNAAIEAETAAIKENTAARMGSGKLVGGAGPQQKWFAAPEKQTKLSAVTGAPPMPAWSPDKLAAAINTLSPHMAAFVESVRDQIDAQLHAAEAAADPSVRQSENMKFVAAMIRQLPREVGPSGKAVPDSGSLVNKGIRVWSGKFDAAATAMTKTQKWGELANEVQVNIDAFETLGEKATELADTLGAMNDPRITAKQAEVDTVKATIESFEKMLRENTKNIEDAMKDEEKARDAVASASDRLTDALKDAAAKRAAIEDEYNDAVERVNRRHIEVTEALIDRLADAFMSAMKSFEARMAAAAGEDAMPSKYKRAIARRKKLEDRQIRSEMSLEMSRLGMGVGELARDPMALAGLESSFVKKQMTAERPLQTARAWTAASAVASGAVQMPEIDEAKAEHQKDLERAEADKKALLDELKSEREESLKKVQDAVDSFEQAFTDAQAEARRVSELTVDVIDKTSELIKLETASKIEEEKRLTRLEKELDAMKAMLKGVGVSATSRKM